MIESEAQTLLLCFCGPKIKGYGS